MPTKQNLTLNGKILTRTGSAKRGRVRRVKVCWAMAAGEVRGVKVCRAVPKGEGLARQGFLGNGKRLVMRVRIVPGQCEPVRSAVSRWWCCCDGGCVAARPVWFASLTVSLLRWRRWCCDGCVCDVTAVVAPWRSHQRSRTRGRARLLYSSRCRGGPSSL